MNPSVSGPAEDAPLAAPVVVARNRFFGPPGVRIGFAYSTTGQPASLDDSPLWCCDSYESIGGGWWIWTQEWD